MLDSGEDRYFALSRASGHDFQMLVAAQSAGVEPEPCLALPLVDLGILVRSPVASDVSPCVAELPSSEWSKAATNQTHLSTVIVALWCIAWAKTCLRILKFDEAISRVKTSPRRTGANLDTDIVKAFAIAVRLFPARIDCLPASIALRRLLLHYGIRPSFVFGVQIAPFAAHCWLQIGSQVAGDSVERVRDFTPIRSIP